MFLALCFMPGSRGTGLGQSQPDPVLKPTTGACIGTARGLHPSAAPLDKSTGNRRFRSSSMPYLGQESPSVEKPQRFSPTKKPITAGFSGKGGGKLVFEIKTWQFLGWAFAAKAEPS